jgi:hypothetical protein
VIALGSSAVSLMQVFFEMYAEGETKTLTYRRLKVKKCDATSPAATYTNSSKDIRRYSSISNPRINGGIT